MAITKGELEESKAEGCQSMKRVKLYRKAALIWYSGAGFGWAMQGDKREVKRDTETRAIIFLKEGCINVFRLNAGRRLQKKYFKCNHL